HVGAVLVDELRAAIAIARKDLRSLLRYRIAVASYVFTPLYQFIIPAFLFGSAFAVNGHASGLATTLGTDDLAGFIFFGGIMGAMVGVAYMLAAIVLLIREANFFIDTANFAFGTITGVSFPITLLPGILQPVALILPTTYAVDILRAQALGSRPLFDMRLEYA